MNARSTTTVMALALALAAGGCALDGLDPLLFDESGEPRASVGADEVAEAGVSEPCSDLLGGMESGVETTRVPVDGGDGPTVLVGVRGMALCIDEEGEGGDEGDEGGLPEQLPTGRVGVASGLEIDEDGQGSQGLTRPTVAGQGSPPITLVQDPTPQPIKD